MLSSDRKRIPAFLVDEREQLTETGRRIIAFLRAKQVEFEFMSLPFADYIIIGSDKVILVEVKTLLDFVMSVRKGRLREQIFRMYKGDERLSELLNNSNVFSEKYLVITGFVKNFKEYRINYDLVTKFIIFVRIVFPDVNILYIPSYTGVGALLYNLYLSVKKGEPKFDILEWLKIKRETLTPEKWGVYVLSSLPMIGRKTAVSLIEKYGSLGNAILHFDEWNVKGKKRKILEYFLFGVKKEEMEEL